MQRPGHKVADGVPAAPLQPRNTCAGLPASRLEQAGIGMLLLVALLAPLANWNAALYHETLPKRAVVQLGALLLLSLWFHSGWRAGGLKVARCAWYWPVGVFLGWAGLSLGWSVNAADGWPLLTHWGACGLLFFLAIQWLTNECRMRWLLGVMLGGGVVTALLVMGQHVLGWQGIRQAVSPAGTFGNRNVCAEFLVLVYPCALYFLWRAQARLAVWLSAAALWGLSTSLLYIQARTGLAVAACQWMLFGLWLAFEWRAQKRPLPLTRTRLAALATAVALTFFSANLTRQGWAWKWGDILGRAASVAEAIPTSPLEDEPGEIQDESLAQRFTFYRQTWRMIQHYPWRGVGLHNWKNHYQDGAIWGGATPPLLAKHIPGRAHNDFLQLEAELGLPFLICLLTSVGLVLKYTVTALRPATTPERRWLALTALAALAGLTLTAAFNFPLYMPVPAFYLALFGALLAQLGNPGASVVVWKSPRAAGVALAGAMGVLVVSVYAGFTHWRWLEASRYRYAHLRAGKQCQFAASIAQGRRALGLTPKDNELTRALAETCYFAGDFAEAARLCRRALGREPHSTRLRLFLGLSLAQLKQFDQARRTLAELVLLAPQDARGYNVLGKVWGALAHHGDSLRELKRATELAPHKAEYWYDLGRQAHQLGRFEEAAAALERCVTLDGLSPSADGLLGIVLCEKLHRSAEGMPHLQRALALETNAVNAAYLKRLLAGVVAGSPPDKTGRGNSVSRQEAMSVAQRRP